MIEKLFLLIQCIYSRPIARIYIFIKAKQNLRVKLELKARNTREFMAKLKPRSKLGQRRDLERRLDEPLPRKVMKIYTRNHSWCKAHGVQHHAWCSAPCMVFTVQCLRLAVLCNFFPKYATCRHMCKCCVSYLKIKHKSIFSGLYVFITHLLFQVFFRSGRSHRKHLVLYKSLFSDTFLTEN